MKYKSCLLLLFIFHSQNFTHMNRFLKSIAITLLLNSALSAAHAQQFFTTMKMDHATLWTYLNSATFDYFVFRYEPLSSSPADRNKFVLKCAAFDTQEKIMEPDVTLTHLILSGPLNFQYKGVLFLGKKQLIDSGFNQTTDLYLIPEQYIYAGDHTPRNYVGYTVNDAETKNAHFLAKSFSLNPSPPRNPIQ